MKEESFTLPPGIVVTRDDAEMPSYWLQRSIRAPLRRSHSRVELILLEQPTTSGGDKVLSIPDALGINGDTQIGLSRASRIMQSGQTSVSTRRPPGRCSICEETFTVRDRPALQVDNSRPFGPLLHKIIFSKTHIEYLMEIGFEEILDSTEQMFEIGTQGAEDSGECLDGLAVGMNFGEYARCGASQIHFHYQVAGLGKANYNPGDRLGELCQAYSQMHAGADYLADYEAALRRADLIIVESDLAVAYVPISPRFKGEVQIMVARRQRGKQAGNILETTAEERKALSRLQYELILRFGHLGCEAMNEVWYMTRFSAKNDWGQRLIISLCPRTAIIAFYELFGNSVIDTLPWTSAQMLRHHEALGFSLRP